MGRVEDLQAIDDKVVYILGLFTQAEQSLEEAHSWAQQHQPDAPEHRELMDAIADCRTEVARVTVQHNMLQGQIRQAKHDAEQAAASGG